MTQHLTLLSLTVGIEGVGPKKPRIQLKVAPSAEDKETTLPAQGSSNPVQGKNTEGQARQLVKGKRKLATEDVLFSTGKEEENSRGSTPEGAVLYGP